jgi:hypothetical protein
MLITGLSLNKLLFTLLKGYLFNYGRVFRNSNKIFILTIPRQYFCSNNLGIDSTRIYLPFFNEFQGSKKKQIPDPKQALKMKRFYNCLACIMTYNLQTLCLKSMKDFTDYILDVGV